MSIKDLTKHQVEREGDNYEQHKFLREVYIHKILRDKKLQKKYIKLFNK